MPDRLRTPPPPDEAKARRLARALRDNLRRRKASAEVVSGPACVSDGADDEERLYPSHPGASGGG